MWGKACVYIQRGLSQPEDFSIFGIWLAIGIELLARSAVASISPVLLADAVKTRDNILYALQIKNDPTRARSISTRQVSDLCLELFSGHFNRDDKDFIDAFIEKRNEELHSGGLPFEIYKPAIWIKKFYKACKALCECQGMQLIDLLGEQESLVAEKILAETLKKITDGVRLKIETHRTAFAKLSDEAKDRARHDSAVYMTAHVHQGEHMCVCPACNSDAGITGTPAGDETVALENNMIVERQPLLPASLLCQACKLKLDGYEELVAAELGDRYTRTSRYTPEVYYGFDYESDLNDGPEPNSRYDNE